MRKLLFIALLIALLIPAGVMATGTPPPKPTWTPIPTSETPTEVPTETPFNPTETPLPTPTNPPAITPTSVPEITPTQFVIPTDPGSRPHPENKPKVKQENKEATLPTSGFGPKTDWTLLLEMFMATLFILVGVWMVLWAWISKKNNL